MNSPLPEPKPARGPRDSDATASVLDAGLAMLDSTAAMLAGLTPSQYTEPSPACGRASIGQHTRHLVDHFAALAHAIDGARVADYDARRRGTPDEADRGAMLDRIRAVRAHFAGLDDVQLNMPVRVRILPAPDAAEVELDSTLARELAFVTHHGIHHHALIKIAAADLGVEVGAGLGVAPSTARASNNAAGDLTGRTAAR